MPGVPTVAQGLAPAAFLPPYPYPWGPEHVSAFDDPWRHATGEHRPPVGYEYGEESSYDHTAAYAYPAHYYAGSDSSYGYPAGGRPSAYVDEYAANKGPAAQGGMMPHQPRPPINDLRTAALAVPVPAPVSTGPGVPPQQSQACIPPAPPASAPVPMQPPQPAMLLTARVSGVMFDYELTKEDVLEVFGRYGRVLQVNIAEEGAEATVQFQEQVAAATALQDLNNKPLQGVLGACLLVGQASAGPTTEVAASAPQPPLPQSALPAQAQQPLVPTANAVPFLEGKSPLPPDSFFLKTSSGQPQQGHQEVPVQGGGATPGVLEEQRPPTAGPAPPPAPAPAPAPIPAPSAPSPPPPPQPQPDLIQGGGGLALRPYIPPGQAGLSQHQDHHHRHHHHLHHPGLLGYEQYGSHRDHHNHDPNQHHGAMGVLPGEVHPPPRHAGILLGGHAPQVQKFTCKLGIGIENDKDFRVGSRVIQVARKIWEELPSFKEFGGKTRLRGRGVGGAHEADEPLQLCISVTGEQSCFDEACALAEREILQIHRDFEAFCVEHRLPMPENLEVSVLDKTVHAIDPFALNERTMGSTFGQRNMIMNCSPQDQPRGPRPPGAPDEEEIERLLEERNDARKAANYSKSDEIRERLRAMHVVVMDEKGAKGDRQGKDVTRWRYWQP